MIFAGRLSTWLQVRTKQAGNTTQEAMYNLASIQAFLNTCMLDILQKHSPGSLGLVHGAVATQQDAAGFFATWHTAPPKGVRALLRAARCLKRHTQKLNDQCSLLIELELKLFVPLRESVGHQLAQLTSELHEVEIGWEHNEERAQLLRKAQDTWEALNAVVSPSPSDVLAFDGLYHNIQELGQQASELRERRRKLASQRERLSRRINLRNKRAQEAREHISNFPSVKWGDLPDRLQMAMDELVLSEAEFLTRMQAREWDTAIRAYEHIGEVLGGIDAICEAIVQQSPGRLVGPKGFTVLLEAPPPPPSAPQPAPMVRPQPDAAPRRKQPQQPRKVTPPTPSSASLQSETVVMALKTLQRLENTARALRRQCRTKSWDSVELDAQETAEFIAHCLELLASDKQSITDTQLAQQLANISEWCAILQKAIDDDDYNQLSDLGPIQRVTGF